VGGGLQQINKHIMSHQKFILHKDLTQKELNEIIEVKSVAWHYSYHKQLDWINSNIKDTDFHVLMYSNKSLVAYLNLIEIEFSINRIVKHGYGIGNVCTIMQGKGFGKEIITKTNSYLTQNNKIGLLFCKELLVDFYKKNNWVLIEKEKLTLSFDAKSIETMIFNCDEGFHHLEFLGKSF